MLNFWQSTKKCELHKLYNTTNTQTPSLKIYKTKQLKITLFSLVVGVSVFLSDGFKILVNYR